MMDQRDLLKIEVKDGNIALVTVLGLNEKDTFSWGTRVCEHRINPKLVKELNAALDFVSERPEIAALVVTAEGKFFCNGMDLQWIDANLSQADRLQADTELLLGRILCFPTPTVAALNGHFCAAGCMLGLSFDYRIMSSDRGLCFVPGIDLGLVYSPGMTNLMKSKCPVHMHNDLIVFGCRYNAEGLLKEGLISKAVPTTEVLSAALQFTQALTKKDRFVGSKYRNTMQRIKRNTYKDTYDALADATNFQGMGFEAGVWDERGRSKL